MEKKRALIWFNNDLRVFDNEALSKAHALSTEVYPVYILDPGKFGTTVLGLPKTGTFRAHFLLETLQSLKEKLQKLGSDLIIRRGLPEEQLPLLAKDLGVQVVYGSKEITQEEVDVEERLETNLLKIGVRMQLYWQSTLFHIEDIPWPIGRLPNTFTDFRKEAEKMVTVRPMAETPKKLNPVSNFDVGHVPTLSELGPKTMCMDRRAALAFKGGERTGLQRVKEYIWKKDKLKTYKDTRNGLIGPDYSSKFSPWLANGALSPKYIYYEVKNYESERVKNQSTYWLVFELLWRDYFKFVAKRYGTDIFKSGGIKGRKADHTENREAFERWKEGTTGIPFVDANMMELKLTGFMSNRGRQNVASYLVNDLHLNWTWGAAYFESILIDYDVCSNWLNWAYIAGVGNDPRKDRYFNIESQVRKYDPKGEYQQRWLGSRFQEADLPK